MSHARNRHFRTVRRASRIVLTLALFSPFTGIAPDAMQPPAAMARTLADEMTGEQIIDRYIEVTGGKPAYEKVKSRVTSGKFSVPAAGINGTMQSFHKAPNLIYVKIDLAGMGATERGFDGQTAWEKSPQTGTRIVTGDERAEFEREAKLNNELDWKSEYTKVENKGVEEVEGKKCYKVELTDKQGDLQTRFYNVDTGLLEQTSRTVKSPMGELPVLITMSDYRDVDGVKMPFKAVQLIKSMGASYEITTDKVETNVDIPANKFELPADVKELAKKSAASPTTQPGK